MEKIKPYLLNWIYRNGKGGTPIPPNLQEKEIEITENGTITIVPDAGYDGLSQVDVNVNITDFVVPSSARFGFSMWNEIPLNFDFSQCNNFSNMFNQNTNLLVVRSIDTSKAYYFNNAFYSCSKLVTVNLIDTGKVTEFNSCFQNCVKLENLPVLDFSSMTNNINMFASCVLLTNESLNNILKSIANGTNITVASWKTLKRMGLTQAQATTCQTLSNWNDFVAAGWSSGY